MSSPLPPIPAASGPVVSVSPGISGGTHWQPGQNLYATVIRSNPGSTSVVQIADQKMHIRLPGMFAPGTRLELQVVQANNTLKFQLLSSSPPSPLSAAVTQVASGPLSIVASGAGTSWLAQILPQQGSQAPLLAALSSLQRHPQAFAALPADIQQAVTRLLNTLPTLTQAIHANALRDAIFRSGLLFEALQQVQSTSTAANAAHLVSGDLKSALLGLATRLRYQVSAHSRTRSPSSRPTPGSASLPFATARTGAAFQPSALPGNSPSLSLSGSLVAVGSQASATNSTIVDPPPPRPGTEPIPQGRFQFDFAALSLPGWLNELRTRTRQALARMVLHQWSSIESSHENHSLRWLVELPLRSQDGIDIIHMLLERDCRRRQKNDEDPSWRVALALSLPELGPIHAHITLAGKQVTTRFWVESPESLRRLRAALPNLRQALEGRSLEVTVLNASAGEPPTQVQENPDSVSSFCDKA